MEYSRVSITPLDDQYSNNVEERELIVNRHDGHITTYRNGEYLSKTKDSIANCSLVEDSVEFMKDGVKKLKGDLENIIDNTLPDLEASSLRIDRELVTLIQLSGEIQRELEFCEQENERQYVLIDNLEVSKDNVYDKYADIKIELTTLERELDELNFLSSEITDWVNHINNKQTNRLAPLHQSNKDKYNNLVTKEEYNAFKKDIENKYKAIGATYTLPTV